MSNSSMEWKFLVVTAITVGALGVPTFASLVSEDGSENKVEAAFRAPSQPRRPASLPHENPDVEKKKVLVLDAKKELKNLISYDLSCGKSAVSEFKVDGGFIQLKGKGCGKVSKLEILSITNKTNGFTASVFQLNPKEYQTDLIQLKQGSNQIVIQFQNANGKVEEQVLNIQSAL